jgi:KDO2-lipid IV(A) lauroyltransferase
MVKRCSFDQEGMKLLDRLYHKKRNFLFVMGHFGNWEWGGPSFCMQTPYEVFALYHPLKNKFFNRLTKKIRTRFGARLIPMKMAVREMVKHKHILNATAFIADQTPSNPGEAYWTTFLNQDTPVFLGTEKIAKRFDYPVVFVSVRKVKRGYYSVNFQLVCEDSAGTPEGFITEAHTRMLEEEINRQPEIWLWSHRRWKHKRQLW